MEERLRRLEAQVAELQLLVSSLRDDAPGVRPAAAAAVTGKPLPIVEPLPIDETPPLDEARPRSLGSAPLAPLIGRTVLVLGGGVLLRALTERGVLSPSLGVAIGLLYALAWLAPLLRRGAASEPASATLHGVAALLLSHLLVWESSVRLGLLTPRPAALVLGIASAAGLALAARHRLRGLAWCFTLGTLATAAGLFVALGAKGATTILLLALGAGTVWLAYLRGWHGLRWPVAALANLTVLVLVQRAAQRTGPPPGYPSPETTQVFGVALLATYLGSFVVRTLVRRRGVSGFEVMQTVGALLCGFGGAVVVAQSGVGNDSGLGLSAVLAALACYAVSFAFVRRTQGRGVNFFFYAYLALALVFLGSPLLAAGPWLAICWLLLALVMALLGGLFDRLTLCIHAAIYSLGGALLAGVVTGFLRLPGGSAGWPLLATRPLLAAVLLAACYAAVASTRRGRAITDFRRAPGFVVAVVAACAAAGLTASVFTRLLAGPVAGPDLAATVRTGVLALAAVLLALASRRPALRELGWLVIPVLVVAGFKLLVEDLRHCGPGTLFAGLLLYGASLILAPRLARRRDIPASPRNIVTADS
jgi:predicted membrane channel-forming protein YqfA (hemolysin III family)